MISTGLFELPALQSAVQGGQNGIGAISASVPIAMPRMHEGQSIPDLAEFEVMTSPSNFASAFGTITGVNIAYLGDAVNADTVLAEDQLAGFTVEVSDSAGTDKVFDAGTVTVEYALRIVSTAENEVELDRNPIATSGVYMLDFGGSDAPYNGIYPLDLSELVAGPVILETAPITGSLDVGSTVTALDCLAVSDRPEGITGRSFQWYAFSSVGQTLDDRTAIPGATGASYVITEADTGQTLLRGETVTDALGTSTEAFTDGAVIFGASSVITDDFDSPDLTNLVGRTIPGAGTWARVKNLTGNREAFVIGGQLDMLESGRNSYFFGLSGPAMLDGAVHADIDTGPSGIALGLIGRTSGAFGNESFYYGRFNRSANAVQLLRQTQSENLSVIAEASVSWAPSTIYELVLRMIGSTIEIDWNGTTEISVTDTSVTLPGTCGIAHYRAGSGSGSGTATDGMRLDNFRMEFAL